MKTHSAATTCRGCGCPLPPSRRRPRIWCSPACRQRTARRPRPERRISERRSPGTMNYLRDCVYCGATFKPSHSHGQRYCSDSCSRRARARCGPYSKVYPRECKTCGVVFIARRSNAVCCKGPCPGRQNCCVICRAEIPSPNGCGRGRRFYCAPCRRQASAVKRYLPVSSMRDWEDLPRDLIECALTLREANKAIQENYR